MQILFTVAAGIEGIIYLFSSHSLLNVSYHLPSYQSLLSPSTSFFNNHSCFPLIIYLSILLSLTALSIPPSLVLLLYHPPSAPASLPSVVIAGAGIWGEGGDNR